MARAASAVLQHQPDSTNPTPPPLSPWRLRSASSSFITLLPFASICPQHRGFTPSGALPGASVRSAATLTQHDTTPISSPVRSHPVPHVNQGRASRPEVDERAARFTRWYTPPAQRCSTPLFLHAGASRIARLIVFRLPTSTAFSCLINVWLIVFFYCRSLPIQVCFGFTETY